MDTRPSMDDQFLALINQIIEDNLADEHFSVEDLAEKAGLSRSMLHRKLIKLTGKSATDLITEIRLTHARELLENNTGTASEIAYQVGFGSPSYFHKVFKKHFGVSPGDVKKGAEVHFHPSQTNQKIKSKGLALVSNTRLTVIAIVILGIVAITMGVIFYLSRDERPVEKSIAILPFDNMSPDEENQYFADGIVEDLLNRLSLIKDLKVISRTSSEMFRDKGNKSIPEIAGILGVSYILEGSVRRETSNIRISIQLIDAKKDDHIFSKQYDRNIGEVFKIQGEIAKQIVNELSIYLSDQQLTEIQKIPTKNPMAFYHFQIGRLKYCFCTKETVLASVGFYNMAIEADSNYALPYAHLALAYRYLAHTEYFKNVKSGRDTAEMMALKALKIDENLAEAHVALGYIYWLEDVNLELAEKEFIRAIELNPNSNEACKKYAMFLDFIGKPEKAREYINKAILVDPLEINSRFNSVIMYRRAGDYDKALEENKRCLEIYKDYPKSLIEFYNIYLGLGDEKAAYESFRYVDSVVGGYPVQEADSAYKRTGIEGLIRLQLSRSNSLVSKAKIHIELGETEKAIDLLESALNNGELMRFDLYGIHHQNPGLKTNPRFMALLKEMDLENY